MKNYSYGHHFNSNEVYLFLNLILEASDQKAMKKILEILFTKDELEKMTRRLQAILLFHQGKTPFQVKKELKMGFSTLSRLHMFWNSHRIFFNDILNPERVEERKKRIQKYTRLTPDMRYLLRRLAKGK